MPTRIARIINVSGWVGIVVTYALLGVVIMLLASGCASQGAVKALDGRLGALEKLATAQGDLLTQVSLRVDGQAGAVKAAGEKLEQLGAASDAAKAALERQGAKLAALEVGAAGHATKAELEAVSKAADEQKKKLDGVSTVVAGQANHLQTVSGAIEANKAEVARIEAASEQQKKFGERLSALLRAHRRGNHVEFEKLRAALGIRTPLKETLIYGFASGKADLDRLLADNRNGSKKNLDRLIADVKAGKAQIFGIMGNQDRHECKKPTAECSQVAATRGYRVARYLGADQALVFVGGHTSEMGSDDRNRAVHVIWAPKP